MIIFVIKLLFRHSFLGLVFKLLSVYCPNDDALAVRDSSRVPIYKSVTIDWYPAAEQPARVVGSVEFLTA